MNAVLEILVVMNTHHNQGDWEKHPIPNLRVEIQRHSNTISILVDWSKYYGQTH